MKQEEIIDALNLLDDNFIQETAQVRSRAGICYIKEEGRVPEKGCGGWEEVGRAPEEGRGGWEEVGRAPEEGRGGWEEVDCAPEEGRYRREELYRASVRKDDAGCNVKGASKKMQLKHRNTRRKWWKCTAAAACAALVMYAGTKGLSGFYLDGSSGTEGAPVKGAGTNDTLAESSENDKNLDGGGEMNEALAKGGGNNKELDGSTGGDSAGLPMLSVPQSRVDSIESLIESSIGSSVGSSIGSSIGGSMGFEGYLAHDADELVNANPWNSGLKISSLPVYKNCLHFKKSTGKMTGGDFGQMKAFLLEIARALSIDAANLEITDDSPTPESRRQVEEKFASTGEEVPEGYFDPTAVLAKRNGIRIKVDEAMTAEVAFEQPVALPEGYLSGGSMSYEEAVRIAKYFEKIYRDLIGMKNSKINISGGGYDIESNQWYEIGLYEGEGDVAEQIVNYAFRRAVFYIEKNGLSMIRLFRPNLSEKIGNYPIITDTKAKELLLNGNYMTTAPDRFPGEQYIVKTELVYRNLEMEEYYMPYYRFYVELPEMERQGGFKNFGIYYVPAIEGDYISNMPVWDGGFD